MNKKVYCVIEEPADEDGYYHNIKLYMVFKVPQAILHRFNAEELMHNKQAYELAIKYTEKKLKSMEDSYPTDIATNEELEQNLNIYKIHLAQLKHQLEILILRGL